MSIYSLHSKVIGIVLLLGTLIPSQVFSDVDSYQFARFGTYFTSYFQPESATSRSGLLLWSPAHHLNKQITLIADLGLTYLNTPDSKFFAIYLSPRFDLSFSNSWSADLSVGTQNWTVEGGFLPMAGVGINYHFKSDPIPFMKSVRLAGNRIWKTDFPTWQVMIGIEFSIGSHEKAIDPVVLTEKAKPVEPVKPLAVVKPELQTTKEGLKLTLSSTSISFASNKTDIPAAAEKYLSAIGKAFASFNDQWSEIAISGHTDSTGKPGKNKQLSLARANSVATLFKSLGVSSTKLIVRGEGSSKPIESNDSIEGRSRNRRVEIAIKVNGSASTELKAKLEEINRSFSTESNP